MTKDFKIDCDNFIRIMRMNVKGFKAYNYYPIFEGHGAVPSPEQTVMIVSAYRHSSWLSGQTFTKSLTWILKHIGEIADGYFDDRVERVEVAE